MSVYGPSIQRPWNSVLYPALQKWNLLSAEWPDQVGWEQELLSLRHWMTGAAWLSRGNQEFTSASPDHFCVAVISSPPFTWLHSGAQAGQGVQPAAGSRARGQSRALSCWLERQQGERQLLLAAQFLLFALPSIPLFPFLPFHPHKFFSQPFQNTHPRFTASLLTPFCRLIPLFNNYNLVVLPFFP